MARAAGDLVLRRFDDVDAFEDHALGFLIQREAEHNLFLGICSHIREGRYADPYLVAVQGPDGVVAAAFRTPPHQLGLSHIDDPASIPLIAADACAAFDALPGVRGRRFVFLCTDLANPTSNSIYQRIGYRPVCDVVQYRFT